MNQIAELHGGEKPLFYSNSSEPYLNQVFQSRFTDQTVTVADSLNPFEIVEAIKATRPQKG